MTTPVRRTAVVTGGNRGIGLEVCRQLAGRGLRVVLASRDLDRGRAVAAELVRQGLEVEARALDVADAASAEAFVHGVVSDLGGADVLVNNAAILQDEDGDVLTIDIATFRASLETNALGALRLCQLLVPDMRTRRYGRVVNVSSGVGQIGPMAGYAPRIPLQGRAERRDPARGARRPGPKRPGQRGLPGLGPHRNGRQVVRRCRSSRGRRRSSGPRRSLMAAPPAGSSATGSPSPGELLELHRSGWLAAASISPGFTA